MSDGKAQAHAPHLDLLPTDEAGNAARATHVAVRDGDWFDARTWAGGEIPGTGALVHIPEGVSVDYEGASAAKLFIVRVDGALNFTAEDGTATKMIVDTLLTAPGSALRVDASAATDGTVDIVIQEGSPAAHGEVYTDLSRGDGVIGRHEWDPEQLSLGIVAAGTVEVHGQAVEASLDLARGPAAGASTLTLNAAGGATGWAVGQKIVVGGMGFPGTDAEGRLVASEDEVREIVGIRQQGDRIVVDLDRPLEHDHRGPVDPATGLEITGQVGNLSRNVTVSSAAADRNGDGIAERGVSLGDAKGAGEHYVTERGHVMFMHNDDVGVTNSAFLGLGRTDKSTDVDDFVLGGSGNHRLHEDNGQRGVYEPDIDVVIETPAEELTNQRGRYALHIHQAGAGGDGHGGHGGHDGHGDHGGHEDAMAGDAGPCPVTGEAVCCCADQDGDGIANHDDADYFDGAYLAGNVVWGSPGWGVVQHDSRALLKGNVVYDVAGAAYVAEIGSETGRWEDNLAVGTYGAGLRPGGDDASDFNEDSGFEGHGFYMKSRALELSGNTAHSSANAAFYYHNHGVEFADTATSGLGELAAIADGAATVSTEDVPIRTFEGNAAYAAFQGIRIVTDPLDSVRKFNDAWSHMKDFTAVAVDEAGVSVTYSSKYIFENFRLFGTDDKMTAAAQQASAGFFFKASAADLSVVGGHVSDFGNAVTNWSMIGDRQEYRRGYWDPKGATSDSPDTPRYEGMGAVDGIENPAWNLWNTNIVGLGTSDIDGIRWRMPGMRVETTPGVEKTLNGALVLGSAAQAPNRPGVEIELLGDSRDGALVALWREDLATNPNQAASLGRATPLAFQESEYLSHVFFENGRQVRRADWQDATPGLNADIWSGTVLEFAKTDSLGRQVFLYGDFSPLDPGAAERTATTNEKILFTREMIDGVLARDGYMRAGGANGDVKFVVMRMGFTDRLTGQIEIEKFLVALDRAWQVPEGARDNGRLVVADDVIVAPEYRVFQNGALVAGRAPIVVQASAPAGEATREPAPAEPPASGEPDSVPPVAPGETGAPGETLRGRGGNDTLRGGDGDDSLLGEGGRDYLVGGAGRDALYGGDGDDRQYGGDGADALYGGAGRDWLVGNAGDDVLEGGAGADVLVGGDGRDSLFGGDDVDRIFGLEGDDLVRGGAGDDRLRGNGGNDMMLGDEGHDQVVGGDGEDVLFGGDGDDSLYGGNGVDSLSGGDGNDRIFGNADADVLVGGAGADAMCGGDGDDLLHGGDDADRLYGGRGNDRAQGGTGDDRISGDSGDDTLLGEEGDDALVGGSGNDGLFGGDGDDRAYGQAGADSLDGGAGADRLYGGDGNDVLHGGTGNDRMTGGEGADRFVFGPDSGADVIDDFEDGVDAIQFLVSSFGFADLGFAQDGSDAVVRHPGGSIRLLDTDVADLDRADFDFLPAV